MENQPKEPDKPFPPSHKATADGPPSINLDKSGPKNPEQKLVGILMLEAGIEFAFLIGAPLLAGVFAGKWLDTRYHHNFFVIIGIFAGLTVTCFAIYKRINDYKKLLK